MLRLDEVGHVGPGTRESHGWPTQEVQWITSLGGVVGTPLN